MVCVAATSSAGPALCFTQPNFKQIWQQGAGLCKRGGEEGAGPLVSLWGKSVFRPRVQWGANFVTNVFFLRGIECTVRKPYMSLWDVHIQGCMFCPLLFSLPTGNNLHDSITLQYLSQSHGRPERLSAPASLPQGRMASLFGLCFSASVSTFSSCWISDLSGIYLSNYSSSYLRHNSNSCGKSRVIEHGCVKRNGGTHIVYSSTDTCVKRSLVKVEVLTQLLYSSKSNEVQALKCTQVSRWRTFRPAISVLSLLNLVSH